MTDADDGFRDLLGGFAASVSRFPDRPALAVDGREHSYTELWSAAGRLAAVLDGQHPPRAPRLTAVLAARSTTAYAGVLAALFRGHAYVPLNPSFPVPRTAAMLARSGARSLIVDGAAAALLDDVLRDAEAGLTIVLPDLDEAGAIQARHPGHRVIGAGAVAAARPGAPVAASPDDVAYLLFTSGSTGQPKGVAVAHRNVRHFIDFMAARYEVVPEDRFTQMFDLTFDLSVFDMFVCWERGACLCCPTKQQILLPARYISDAGVSIWFSVPSTGVLMNRLRLLAPGAFPGLRLSLFCGEALPLEMTAAWAKAAPNSVIENLYGPTELTIACSLYRWATETTPAECEQGMVPIGEPYPGMRALVVDPDQRPVPVGEAGELLMAGPQVTLGYWNDPEKTAAAFVTPPGETKVHYRTGDLVRRPAAGRPMTYLGRVDNQVKVHGYRVELGEIEAALRTAGAVDVAVALGWPRTATGCEGIVAFTTPSDRPVEAIRRDVAARLPKYMVPREIRFLDHFPLNVNGKIDRKALYAILENQES